MKEGLIGRADQYFRREDTKLARAIRKVSSKEGLEYRKSFGKDIFERAVALPVAVATLPVMGVLAAKIKLEDGGDVFYREKRIGKNGEPVTIVKFRSLKMEADQDVEANIANALAGGSVDDPRSTKVGKFMRSKKLDELPQLWQVVTGKISLFGMRADNELTFKIMKEKYPQDAYKVYEQYITSKGGLINPVFAFTRSNKSVARKHLYALYGRKSSLGMDLYMGFRTLTRIFSSENKKTKIGAKKSLN